MRYDYKTSNILNLIYEKIGVDANYLKNVGLLNFVVNHNNHSTILFALLKVWRDDRDKKEMQKHFFNYLNKVISNKKKNEK